jgi:REP element-mobilizing transposase RayT
MMPVIMFSIALTQKQEVFHNDQDFETFLSIVAHYKLKYKFKIYHLSLMPNHFHFEFKIKNAEILPKAQSNERYHSCLH